MARKLRKDGTKGEAIFWDKVLRAKQFYGYQFNRQFCIDDYIADFICRKLKLIIEVDGYSHKFREKKDKIRDRKLKELGYTTLRFSEKEILHDLDNVIRVLESYLPSTNRIFKTAFDQSSCPSASGRTGSSPRRDA